MNMSLRKLIKLLKKKEQYPVPLLVNSNELLKGKNALITGGNSGIGFAIAKDFIANGAKVIICGRNKDKLATASKELGEKSAWLSLDVTDTKNLSMSFDKAVELFPEHRIDIVVNSAGIGAKSGMMDLNEDEYDAIMNTNAKATFFMVQTAGKYMIQNNVKGHILNVSSSSALRPAWSAYEMSKWAVRGFTLGAADILAKHGIVVNAIGPGPTATPMLGMGDDESIYIDSTCNKRCAMPNEIASLATYMCSDMGNMIIGDTFYITGGAGNIKNHI